MYKQKDQVINFSQHKDMSQLQWTRLTSAIDVHMAEHFKTSIQAYNIMVNI